MAVLKTRLLIAFIMLFCVNHAFSRIIISNNNGKMECLDGIPVLKNESYSCIYTYGHVGLWRIAVTQRDGSESRTKTPIEGLGFSFAVSEIPKRLFTHAKRINIGVKTYFKGWVLCKDGGTQDSLEVYFDLLPSKPIIKKASLEYSSFDKQYLDFVDNYLDCVIHSENCDYLEMYVDGDRSWMWPDWNSNFTISYSYKMKADSLGEDLYHIKEELGYDWDFPMLIWAYNAYGSSQPSDTLTIEPYIPEDILKYIKEFKFEDTGVKVPQQADREVIVAGNTIRSPLEWKQLQVFGMDGKCYYHSAKYQPTVKLPISLNGVYIMRILLSDNNKTVKKIKL